MGKKLFPSLLTILIAWNIASVPLVFADDPIPPTDTESTEQKKSPIPKPASDETLNVGKILKADGQKTSPNIGLYIVRFVNFISLSIGSFAFLAIVIGGIILVTSGGREAELTKGKDIIKFAIIGIVIALSAYWITAFTQSIFFEYG